MKASVARLRQALGPVWGPAALLFLALRAGDMVNMAIGLWIVPSFCSDAELAAVKPLAAVATALSLPLSILLVPYAKLLNVHAARGEYGKAKAMIRDAGWLALAVLAATLLAMPFVFRPLFRLFGLEAGRLDLAVVLCSMVAALAPVFTETLRAFGRFAVVSAMSVAAAPVRLVAMLLALPFRGLTGYWVGQAAGPAFQSAVALWDFLRRHGRVACENWWRSDRRVFVAYAVPLAISAAAGNFRGVMEALPLSSVPDLERAAVYPLAQFSEIASFLGSSVVFVLFPVVSSRHERGERTRALLLRSMGLTLGLGVAFSAALGLAGPVLFRLIPRFRAFVPFARLLFPLGVLASVRVSASCFTTHETACGRFGFLLWTVPVALAEAAALAWVWRGPAAWDAGSWTYARLLLFIGAGTVVSYAGNVFQALRPEPPAPAQDGTPDALPAGK